MPIDLSTDINPATGKPARPLGRQPASRLRVSPAVKVACNAIVYEGKELDEAAKDAGITTRALRLALERPHVLAHLKAEKEVFRGWVSAQNIHHAVKLRESGNAIAKLGAIKYLDNVEEHAAAQRGVSPGFTVVVVNNGVAVPQMVDITPRPIGNGTD